VAQSVGAALKPPCCFEGILNGASVAPGEVSDNHHVLDVPGRDAEGSGKLPQYRVAVIEIGADRQVHVVKLAGDQPAVVPHWDSPSGAVQRTPSRAPATSPVDPRAMNAGGLPGAPATGPA
jgi:hypothetical protein